MIPLNIKPKQLHEGCLQAAITHAVAVGLFPELNYEHSWDSMNYCMNDSQGCRATITFHDKYIIAVFQDIHKLDWKRNALDFFIDAPDELIKIAKDEALQYVLQEVDGEIKPIITAAFWGTWDQLNRTQPYSDIISNGGKIINTQLLRYDEALEEWRVNYDLDTKQICLIQKLFDRRISANCEPVFLDTIDFDSLYGDIEECLISLGKLNILSPK